MKLSIGTAQFGFKYGICNKSGVVSLNEINRIIKFCKSKKISSIDTAESYGKSQKILGNLNIKNFKITSKISNLEKKKIKNLEHYITLKIDKILDELKIKKMHALLIHDTSVLKGKLGKDFYDILQKLKKKKKFVKLGVSVYRKNELDLVIKNFKIDIVNLPISVANQEFCANSYLSKIKKKKIEVHARSIFLQGLLLTSYKQIPLKFKNDKFFFEWFRWLKTNNYNSLDASLGFIKKFKDIDKIIIGIDNLYQLKMIEKAYNKKINFKFKKFYQSSILKTPFKW